MTDYAALHQLAAPLLSGPVSMADYVFGSLAADNVTTPFEWDTSRLPLDYDLKQFEDTVENQERYSSCVGNALSTQLELYKALRGHAQMPLSRLFPYYCSREVLALLLSKPVADTGTSITTAMSTLLHTGICKESVWPYTSPVNGKPSEAAYADAALRKSGRYERVALNTFNLATRESRTRHLTRDLKTALYHGMPVIFGIQLHESFYATTGPLETHPAQYKAAYAGSVGWIGGHAMTVIGWRTLTSGRTLFIVENSWGAGWGDGGFWGVTAEALSGAFDLFVVRDFEGARAEIPLSMYRFTADCELKDGTSVSIQPHAAQAYRLYRAAFCREPDLEGLGWHIAVLELGFTLSQVAQGFIDSPEFAATYGQVDDTRFVTLLYRNVLSREPDADGLAYHLARLAQGVSRPDVLIGFSESPENIAATPTHNGVRFIRRTV